MNTRSFVSIVFALGFGGGAALIAQTPKENQKFKAERRRHGVPIRARRRGAFRRRDLDDQLLRSDDGRAKRNAGMRNSSSPVRPRRFETMNGSQDFSRTAPAPEHFDLGFNTPAKSPQAELEDVQRQMNDAKLTDTQRNALMMRMGAI